MFAGPFKTEADFHAAFEGEWGPEAEEVADYFVDSGQIVFVDEDDGEDLGPEFDEESPIEADPEFQATAKEVERMERKLGRQLSDAEVGWVVDRVGPEGKLSDEEANELSTLRENPETRKQLMADAVKNHHVEQLRETQGDEAAKGAETDQEIADMREAV